MVTGFAMTIINKNFLLTLQREARVQKKLNEKRIFPELFDGITSFVGIYSWQFLLVLSIATVMLIRLLK